MFSVCYTSSDQCPSVLGRSCCQLWVTGIKVLLSWDIAVLMSCMVWLLCPGCMTSSACESGFKAISIFVCGGLDKLVLGEDADKLARAVMQGFSSRVLYTCQPVGTGLT